MKLISQSGESSGQESKGFPRAGCGSSYMRIKSPSHLERLGNGDEPGFEPIQRRMRLRLVKVCSKPLRESVLEP